jgi:hypothetical protein
LTTIVSHTPASADPLPSKAENIKEGLAMGAIWIVVGVTIAVAVAKVIVRARNRSSEANLGFVSRQWLAEHRVS